MSGTDDLPPYDPGIYRARFETPLGHWLWQFVNRPDNIVRMETATSLERPAPEAIGEQLVIEIDKAGFGEEAFTDRDAQMVGHMVKQVMGRHGYVVDQGDVRITSGAPFTRATRYKRREDFTYHVFRASDFHEVALTASKETGKSLPPPPNGGRWRYDRSFAGDMLGVVAFGLPDPKKAKADIQAQGFHRYRQERMFRALRPRGAK